MVVPVWTTSQPQVAVGVSRSGGATAPVDSQTQREAMAGQVVGKGRCAREASRGAAVTVADR